MSRRAPLPPCRIALELATLNYDEPLRIDVERFLCLAAAIATAHCVPVRTEREAVPHQQPTGDAVTVVIAAAASVEASHDPPDVDPEPILSGGCNNDEGVPSCAFAHSQRFAGPACEGFAGSCESLQNGYGYRPRIAAAIARCWERRGTAACNINVRKRCIRNSLAEACPDPQFTASCEQTLTRCRQRGQKPRFSVGECVKALSSLEGRELDWARSAMGPSGEGCKLMFPVY